MFRIFYGNQRFYGFRFSFFYKITVPVRSRCTLVTQIQRWKGVSASRKRLFCFSFAGHHHRRAEGRHSSAAGDAFPAQIRAKGQRRGALLRPGRQLRTGAGMVSDTHAVLVPGPDHH